jgi:hypothetical protein
MVAVFNAIAQGDEILEREWLVQLSLLADTKRQKNEYFK